MPVGAWELEYGCYTLADPNRTAAYVANAQDPAYCEDGINVLAPVAPAWTGLRVNCGCNALQWTADAPGETPYLIPPYTSPADDGAPWYDASVPESAHFHGWMVERIEEVQSAPTTRTVTDRVSTFGGAALGALRRKGRAMKVTLIGFGAYEAAMDYGFRWLGDVLTSSTCDLCDMTVRTACPILDEAPTYDQWDVGRWTFKQVGLIEGPRYDQPPNPNATCNVRRAVFTMTASVPYGFKCPVQQGEPVQWMAPLWSPPAATSDAVLWYDAATAFEADPTTTGSIIQNLGTAGSTLNGAYDPPPATTDLSRVWVLPHDGINYAHLPMVKSGGPAASNDNYLYVTTAQPVEALSGKTLDVAVRFSAETPRTTGVLVLAEGGYDAVESKRWRLSLDCATSSLFATVSDDGVTTATYTASDPLTSVTIDTDLQRFDRQWVRLTLSGNFLHFYHAADKDTLPNLSDWTQVGVGYGYTPSLWTSSADMTFFVGGNPSGETIDSADARGWMSAYRVVVKRAVGGDTVIDIDAALIGNGSAVDFLTAGGGDTVTIASWTGDPQVGATYVALRSALAVCRPLWLFDRLSVMSTVTTAAVNFGANQNFTAMMIGRRCAIDSATTTPLLTEQKLISKINPAGDTGWALIHAFESGTETRGYGAIGDGTMQYTPTDTSPALYTNRVLWASALTRSVGDLAVTRNEPIFTEQDDPLTGVASIDATNTAPIYYVNNPDYTAGSDDDITIAVAAVLIWRRALSINEIAEVGTWYNAYTSEPFAADNPRSVNPPVDWMCGNTASTCFPITASSPVGEEALIIEVAAGSAIVSDLTISITPDPWGYVCGTSTPPFGWVQPEPCDQVVIPILPAGYTLTYDSTTQSITVRVPGGATGDGTFLIDTSTGIAPSFPVIKSGQYCVCISSPRCSWAGGDGTVTVSTVHRELTI